MLLLLLPSCLYKDLGNYDYDMIPEVVIEGIVTTKDGGYGNKTIFKDVLTIKPIIKFGKEDISSFECKWYKRGATLELISEEAELNFPLNQNGFCMFQFVAKHKTLGISKRVETSCIVQSETETGWYVLKETADGRTELDGWYDLDKDDVFTVTPNLITAKLGASMESKPIAINYYDQLSLIKENGKDSVESKSSIRISSENDMAIFDLIGFDCTHRFNDLLTTPFPVDGKINAVFGYGNVSGMIYDEGTGIRSYSITKAFQFFDKFRDEYKVSTKFTVPKIYSNSSNALVYEEKTSLFKCVNGFAPKFENKQFLDVIPPQLPATGMNAKLLFIGQKESILNKPAIGYAIVEKYSDPDSLIILQLDLTSVNNSTTYDFLLKADTLYKKTNLRKYEFCTLDQSIDYLYYTVKNKFYSYNLNGKVETAHETDFVNGEEITYMKHLNLTYSKSYEKPGLYIATYKNGRYKLYRFAIQAGIIQPNPHVVLEGEGKFKAAIYTAADANKMNTYIYY